MGKYAISERNPQSNAWRAINTQTGEQLGQQEFLSAESHLPENHSPQAMVKSIR
jgi:hypothetical protein